jgi:type I restriction enzyme R subunit
MLRLQLSLLRHERSFTRWSNDVREIASALNEKTAIPMARAELELIIELQTDEYWQDITTVKLEDVRKRLRSLVKFIERDQSSAHLYGLRGFDGRRDRDCIAGIRFWA